MPQRESNPMERVVSIWREPDQSYRDHIKHLWPDLAVALEALEEAQDHLITDPSTVHVRPVAPPAPVRAPRGRSAGRSGPSGTRTTSTPTMPGQMPLFDETKDK